MEEDIRVKINRASAQRNMKYLQDRQSVKLNEILEQRLKLWAGTNFSTPEEEDYFWDKESEEMANLVWKFKRVNDWGYNK